MTTQNTKDAKKKIVEKIKKLLSLVSSPNENEATEAAKLAQQLLSVHNISLDELNFDTVKELAFDEFIKVSTWKKILISSVARNNFCIGVLSKVTIEGKNKTIAKFVGRESNIEVSKLMYEYLLNAVQKLAKSSETTKKDVFKLGCSIRISERLSELTEKSKTEGFNVNLDDDIQNVSALAVSNLHTKCKEEIDTYVKQKNIKAARKVKQRSLDHEGREAYIEGLKAGEKVSLNKQIVGV